MEMMKSKNEELEQELTSLEQKYNDLEKRVLFLVSLCLFVVLFLSLSLFIVAILSFPLWFNCHFTCSLAVCHASEYCLLNCVVFVSLACVLSC